MKLNVELWHKKNPNFSWILKFTFNPNPADIFCPKMLSAYKPADIFCPKMLSV